MWNLTRRIGRRSVLALPMVFSATRLLADEAVPNSQKADGVEPVLDQLRTKVVVLKIRRPSGSTASGTGFVVAPGVVLTAGHVVPEDVGVTAWLNGVGYRADLVRKHPDLDVAVLRLSAPSLELKPVTLAGMRSALSPGEPLMIVTGPSQASGARGEPESREAVALNFKERRRLTADRPSSEVLVLTGQVRLGDSGSPVVRVMEGTVIGLLSSREVPDASGQSHFAYVVPAESFAVWLRETLTAPDREEFYLKKLVAKPT